MRNEGNARRWAFFSSLLANNGKDVTYAPF